MATALSAFYDEIRTRVPGCPNPIILRETRNVIRDFCERTTLWKYTLDAIDIVADTYEYTMTAPTDSELLSGTPVLEAYFNDVLMTPKTREDFKGYSSWQTATSSKSSAYFIVYPNVIRLYPIPDTALTDGLDIYVALKPSLTATTVEDFFYNSHRNTIISGVLSILLKQRGMPWYDEVVGMTEALAYKQGVSVAWSNAQRGHIRGGLRAKPRVW